MPRVVGFSSGCLAPGRPASAVELCLAMGVRAIELSALRVHEMDGVIATLSSERLSDFAWVSVHAPSAMSDAEEAKVVRELLAAVGGTSRRVIVHPDAIHVFERWRELGSQVLIENMDRRKKVGRYADEFARFYEELPGAGLCLDVAHARQVDPSLVEAYRLLERYGDRLGEVHLSEVTAASRHGPLSLHSHSLLSEFLQVIPDVVPIIIESAIETSEVTRELAAVTELLSSTPSSAR